MFVVKKTYVSYILLSAERGIKTTSSGCFAKQTAAFTVPADINLFCLLQLLFVAVR